MNIELIILAAVAVFVISRLYAVLGQRTGTQPPRARPLREGPSPIPQAEEGGEETEERPRPRPSFSGPGAAGLESIAARDETFNPDDFAKGARRAYETIVGAFADGNRDGLRPLLDDDVFAAWSQVITDREQAGTEPMRLLRLKSTQIVDASLDAADIARVAVSFESELGDGETTRRAREIWTFKRQVDSPNPNWLLDEVTAAS